MASGKILPADSPQAISEKRGEVRCPTALPLRLTSESGAMIPAVILNLSASGLLALVDIRSSPLLPPTRGSRFEGTFFFDEIELRRVVLEVTRIERRSPYLIALGCRLVEAPSRISAALRAKITARLTALRGWQTVSVRWQSAGHDN
ncbi:MAG: PilZ domain-containing protein [Candidatus Binatia bacterium]